MRRDRAGARLTAGSRRCPSHRRGGACPSRPSRTRDSSGPPSQSPPPPRGLDREDRVIKKYRGLAPRGTFVRGGGAGGAAPPPPPPGRGGGGGPGAPPRGVLS